MVICTGYFLNSEQVDFKVAKQQSEQNHFDCVYRLSTCNVDSLYQKKEHAIMRAEMEKFLALMFRRGEGERWRYFPEHMVTGQLLV